MLQPPSPPTALPLSRQGKVSSSGLRWIRAIATASALVGAALVFLCALWAHFAMLPPNTCRPPRSDAFLFAAPLLSSSSGPQPPSASEILVRAERKTEDWLYVFLHKEDLDLAHLENVFPVLFVHGHAGEWQQGKHLAHVFDRTEFQVPDHMTVRVFTIDFAKRRMACRGDLLGQQAHFVNQCIRHILHNFLKGASSVVVVGHSMGGLVSRATMMQSNYLPGSISALVTLGTPHRLTSLQFDRTIFHFYWELQRFWDTHPEVASSVKVLSISGGWRDTMISGESSVLSSVVPEANGLYVLTSSIPGLWASVDHDGLYNCDRLLTILVRCVLDIMATNDEAAIVPLFRKHFTSNVPEALALRRNQDKAREISRTPEEQRSDGEDQLRPAMTGHLPLLALGGQDGGYAYSIQLKKWTDQYNHPALSIVTTWPSAALTITLIDQNNGRQEKVCRKEWGSVVRDPEAARVYASPDVPPTVQVLLLRSNELEGYAEVRIGVSPSVVDGGGDRTKALVQIFNAAPSSAKLTGRFMPQFSLLSTFTPSCLADFAAPECRDGIAHPMVIHLPVDSQWLPQRLHIRQTPHQTSTSDGALPLFAPTLFQFYECNNGSRLSMRDEATHVFPEPYVALPVLDTGARIRSLTRPLPGGFRDACNSQAHHLVLLTDPRFSYQVTFESDHVSFVAGFLGMYVALLIPSAFMWYFAALAYQFHCWRLIGSFPPLVATLHRLAAHLGGLFVVAYVVGRLLPYLKLQTIRYSENLFSWTFATDRAEAFPPHLFLVVPFLSCMVVLGLGYAQAIGLALGTPALRKLGAFRDWLVTRAGSALGQRSARRAGHAWKLVVRSSLFQASLCLLVALCSLYDSLYVWIPMVVVLTAFRPNHPQERTSGWNFRRTWAILFLLRIVQSFVCLNNPLKLALCDREIRFDEAIAFALTPLVFGSYALSITNSALPKDRLMTYAPLVCLVYILLFCVHAPFKITTVYSCYALFMLVYVAFHRWRKRNGLA